MTTDPIDKERRVTAPLADGAKSGVKAPREESERTRPAHEEE